MIAIIDYDAGNIKSVEKACRYLGYDTVLTRDRKEILSADHIILPGVGSFGDAMEHLEKYGLSSVIRESVEKEIPFLGICLGMQVLFEDSEESPGVLGLHLLDGHIVRFSNQHGLKIPQIGWNSLEIFGGRLFRGLSPDPYVYFVHSYYLKAAHEQEVKAICQYGDTVHASVESGNLFACQFHPEKSGEIGLGILKNFAEI